MNTLPPPFAMRRTPPAPRGGFTLLELLTVIGIVVVLAALILGGMGYAQRKAASSRAAAEISALSNLIEAFKTDFGDYPRSSEDGGFPESTATDSFVPNIPEPKNENYASYSAFLTHHLFGGQKDIPASPNPAVANWSKRNNWAVSGLSTTVAGASVPDQEGNPTSVSTFYLLDPFGNAYGYSTQGKFSPTFQLWSFGGEILKDEKNQPLKEENDPDKGYSTLGWIKNW